MEFKGTKGKWELKDCTLLNPNRDSKKGNIWEIAQCYTGFNEKETITQCKANALLISKAPEMFEMLKDILSGIRGENFEVTEYEIEQLIKQATEL